MINQKRETLMNGIIFNHMIIIQNEDKISFDACQLVSARAFFANADASSSAHVFAEQQSWRIPPGGVPVLVPSFGREYVSDW